MDAHAHFAQLARYNVWATTRLLAAIARLSDDDYRRDVGLYFKSIHGTLNHLLVGEHLIWFRRFSLGESPQESEGIALDMEPERDRVRLAKTLQDGSTHWAPLIASWLAERFEGALKYTTMKGEPVALPFADTLAHVFNHGTHHRGQISAALTGLGQPCPDLDLVVLLQQESKAKKSTP